MISGIKVATLLSAIMPLVLGVLMIIYWRTRKTYRGYGFWMLSNLSIGFGYLLLGLRTQIPDFFSIVTGNALIILGLILIYEGAQLFFDGRALDGWNYGIFGVFVVLQFSLTFVHPQINSRIILVSVFAAVLELRTSIVLFHKAPPKLRQITRILAIIFSLAALASFLRAAYAFEQSQPINILNDGMFAALSIAAICALTVWNFYFFFLNSAHLELELEEATRNSMRKIAQLALLEETSKRVAESLDEKEILQRTVDIVIEQFGYAEAAISLLIHGDQLEVTVLNGTENIGYHPGFRQNLGEGIIGHTAEKKQPYISNDIEHDAYYFTIGQRSGSAIGVPMLMDEQVLGVLYVESSKKDAFNEDDAQTLQTLVSHTVTAVQKARLYARTQAHLRALTTMQSVSQAIVSSLDVQQIYKTVVQLLKDAFNYKYISIYIIEGQFLHLGAELGYPQDATYFEIPLTTGITSRAVHTKQIQFVPDVSKDPDFLRASYEIKSEICVPLINEGNVLGILNVEEAPGRDLTEDDVEALAALAGPVVVAIENARLHAEVKQLALTDALTNLPNRRAFDLILENEVERAKRYDYPLSLIMIDMDEFKEYNDQWGHPAGDVRLKAVAELFKDSIRNPDVAARYGGEEFALILPYTTKDGALILSKRLQATAKTYAPEKEDHKSYISGYTFSMGVASFPEDAGTAAELLNAADQAELTAKKTGKDRICIAGANRNEPNP